MGRWVGGVRGLGQLVAPQSAFLLCTEAATTHAPLTVPTFLPFSLLCAKEVEAARRLPRGVQELGEEEMGRLAAASREAGLEQLFLTALKLSPGR